MREKSDVSTEEVRKIVKSTNELPKMLDLIITLQRLGLDIYYENEINELLHIIYNSDIRGEDLHFVSLRFYLLRKNGYDVSAGMVLFALFLDIWNI
jgi:hypothetical protein